MKKRFFLNVGFIVIILLTFSQCKNKDQNYGTDLEAGFLNPPASAKPRVWWHWMNGNITRDGIQKDLEWMNRIGIGGFQNFDAALRTPQIVEKRLVYMTPEWKESFKFTTDLADSLGLEMAIAGSPGWSESGGPWVPPSEGMKKYVWSETIVEGGKLFKGQLPHPPDTSGAFQNIGHSNPLPLSEAEEEAPEFYSDAAVIAYKIPDKDLSLKDLNPKVTSSGGTFSLEMLTDGDLSTTAFLPAAPAGKSSWIQFEFDRPQSIHSISMVGGGNPGRFGFGNSRETRALESSEDGRTFRRVSEIPAGGVAQNTVTFQPVAAKFFRVAITLPASPAGVDPLGGLFGIPQDQNQRPSGTQIAEIVLDTVPRINRFEEKAGFSVVTNVEKFLTPEIAGEEAIHKQEVINLTDEMKEDGSLDWTPPEGKWNILRIGYSLTGHQNSPASPEATGLEVDKLNPDFVRNYFNNYLDQYEDATGGLMGERGLQYVITDSWEAGTANWTDHMIEEFNKRNSYDIIPWLPALTGKIVESSEKSEKFLWDFRNTLEEMVAEYHYDELTFILKERGMGRYTESHENGRAFIADGMEVKRSADIPMSATWTPGGFGGREEDGIAVRHEADIRESASVAHIYGQNLVAAESLTAIGNTWAYAPERLKPTADFMLASGLNRFVIHTSVHQPVDDKIPGLGLGPFGQWFTRHETWAEQAKPWIDYLARSSYMLQQGNFAADILYIYGQGSNLTSLFGAELPPIPEGYNYDFLNAGAVANVLSVKEGHIVTETGMSYKILVLDESTRTMTLPVLAKIEELVHAGAVVAGPKPVNTPSLNDDEAEFSSLADRLWTDGRGIKEIGKGKIYAGFALEEALNDLGVEPDFKYSGINPKTKMRFVHRSLGDLDIYWINTSDSEHSQAKASFRISGKEPEVWNPVDGSISPVSYAMNNGRTEVTLNMDPDDALFVVFRRNANKKSAVIPEVAESERATITGEWEVHFQPDRGAPEKAVFSELSPWNENKIPGIKYFSGTAEYTNAINIPEEWISENSNLWLDLGEVKNLAEVVVNGESMGIVWKKPFRVCISESLKPGENRISVQVTNLWVNRLIGDRQPGVTDPVTYTTQAFYSADSPLLPSGLLGPVKIVGRKQADIN
ncbi:MAG: discoidin domain-containing protein [Acidobacteria bacterium]|nr:discoidin domain-containing protein [Acidobacteriota bacterium]